MFQENTRDKFGFLEQRAVESVEIVLPNQENRKERPLLEEREWDPTISDKLLWSPPKRDKDGHPILNSETLEKVPTNAYRILIFDNRLKGRIAYDEARRSCVIRDEVPYEEQRLVKWTEIPSLYKERPWRILGENDITWISGFLATHYRLKLGRQELRNEIDMACDVFRFHSIRDWLERLEWDGSPRLEDWLIRLCGAADTKLNRAYCLRILQSAVARAYEPGCKVDTMSVLTGGQGGGKSTLWYILAGALNNEPLHVIFNEKIGSDNATRVLHSAWIVDLDECASLKRCRDPELPKQWITKRRDAIVQKFKNEVENWARSSIFVASTNPTEFIRDPAGARRWWVIEVKTILLREIAKEREQLWAEAVVRYKAWKEANDEFELLEQSPDSPGVLSEAKEKADELHWTLPSYLWAEQAESVGLCLTELDFEQAISAYLEINKIQKISTKDIIEKCIRIDSPAQKGDAESVSLVMRRLGWEKAKYREYGAVVRGWSLPEK